MTSFDKIVNRRGTGCYKWDASDDPEMLPMFVADMDFQVAPAITQAIIRRAEHGIYGYVKLLPDFYDAIVQWNQRRHHWHIDPSTIVATNGIVPAISAILRALTQPGDGVMIQTPVYNCFFHDIEQNNCKIVENPLIYDVENLTYHIDFDDFEAKAADANTRLFILCNPHNPVGRVWTRSELERMAEICLKHDVLMISDEIHCDIIMPGHTYTPMATLSENVRNHLITCISPSKAFNIAGLQIAAVVIDNPELRERVEYCFHVNGIWGVNAMGVEALKAAYNESEKWLEDVNAYIWENYQTLCKQLAAELPGFPVIKLEGTYLAWVDCSKLGLPSDKIDEILKTKGHIYINHGAIYGSPGTHFIRINLSCPRALLEEGIRRIVKTLKEVI